MLPPRPRREPPRASRDRWLISYADFITLLFAFFTTMYAVSTVDAAKLATIADGLQQAFASQQPVAGPGRSGRGLLPGDHALVGASGEDARAVIARALADEIRDGRLEISQDTRGLVLSMPEAGTFPVGNADLTPAAERELTGLAAALAGLPNAVRVEGHTDDVPIHTSRFTSNWDLATARAVRVVQFLIERGGLPPDRLSAAGYGEFHPRVANDSPAARSRNRRVDIVLLTPATRASEEPASKGPRP